ncbi:hypothetical protein GQ53DRAFT_334069 [Thozetella sp. PMI_491]|nr:hypothetical protein GQ53DRAFT_334069 [Thozetella sp. PMI_491]
MAAERIPRYSTMAIETLSAEDFETASIRSAAPSYISDVPSYHSTVPVNEPIPPYSPPASTSLVPSAEASGSSTDSTTASTTPSPPGPHPHEHTRSASVPSTLPSETRTYGLPPVPTGPLRRHSDVPTLGEFRIPSWSHINSNPTYQRVANRRATAAAAAAVQSNRMEGLKRMVLTRIEEEERINNRFRPLEDPYLVGEEAAARARRERLARESGEVLFREDRHWDWFLSQVKDRDGRERLRYGFQGLPSRPRLARGVMGRS